MLLDRRDFLKAGAANASVLFASFLGIGAGISSGFGFLRSSNAQAEAAALAEGGVKTGANGLYVQPWFEDSFLDLGEELETAALKNKQLVLIFEQTGCPYCKELHKVNLSRPEIADFMKENYHVVQLDIRGSREVVDFNGNTLSETGFARQAQIHFTPTLSFFPRNSSKVIGKTGRDAEAFRLTGYWKPFHFETVLRFVRDGAYKEENLQTYLSERLEALKREGKTQEVWD